MIVKIRMDAGTEPYVEIVIEKTEDFKKLYNMQYHLDQILKILKGTEEDED